MLAMVKQTIGLFLLYFQGMLVVWNITSEFPESGANRSKFQVHGDTGYISFRYTEDLQLAWKSVELKNVSNIENFTCICSDMHTHTFFMYTHTHVYIYIYVPYKCVCWG